MVREYLAPFSLPKILVGLARLSAQLNTWRNAAIADHSDLEAARQTLPSYYPAIKRLIEADSDRVVLSRANILYVAKQALIACSLEGRDVDGRENIERVMSCCLMANDLLLPKNPSPDDDTIERAVGFLPFNSYLPFAGDALEIARNLILIQEIAPQCLGQSDYRDLANEFLEGTSFTAQQFCELMYCAATKFITNLVAQNDSSGLILSPDYFRHTSIPGDVRDKFLKDQTIALVELQKKARQSNSNDGDFLLFQDRPLIEFEEQQYLCIDPGFLLDKAGRSFYWTLHNHSAKSRRDHLLTYWSSVVEKYVQWLVSQSYRGSGVTISDPRFANGDQACDILIREGRCVILIEVKASTLTTQSKYGFDAMTLRTELLLKAIEGEDGKRKGIAQLHDTIARFQGGEAIAEIVNGAISMIYPVLVFVDRSFVSPYLPALYQERFVRRSLRDQPKVAAPYSISLGEFEDVLPFTLAHNLSDMFDSYFQHKRRLSGVFAFPRFSRPNIPLLYKAVRGTDLVEERLGRFHNELIRNTFGASEK
jgi:hypothetical protein